jgi:hypothetical protein
MKKLSGRLSWFEVEKRGDHRDAIRQLPSFLQACVVSGW